jgi:hypothetical protein
MKMTDWDDGGYNGVLMMPTAVPKDFLESVWLSSLLGAYHMDGYFIWYEEKLVIPANADRIIILPLSGKIEVDLRTKEGRYKETLITNERHLVVMLEIHDTELAFSRTASAIAVVFYRIAVHKPVKLLHQLRGKGFYPHQVHKEQKWADGVPQSGFTKVNDILDVERWKLRARQEKDDAVGPILQYKEMGYAGLYKKYGREIAEKVIREDSDFVLDGGLIHRVFRNAANEAVAAVYLPAGAMRSYLGPDGKTSQLSWLCAGGHTCVGLGCAPEQRNKHVTFTWVHWTMSHYCMGPFH